MAPLLALAMARNREWRVDIHVSRQVVFHTATLLASGCFLLAVAIVGIVLRKLGGDWGLVLQLAMLFGSIVGVGIGLSLLVPTLLVPGFADSYMRHIFWGRFIAYTAVLEIILVKYCPPRPPLVVYWCIFGGLFLLHTACATWILLRVAPLASIHYVIFGPFEFMALYFLLSRGVQYVAPDKSEHR